MSNSLAQPYPMYFDADGKAVEGGKLFVGVAGLNPLSNPQAAYWDGALTIPAADIRISGGFPVYNGKPGRVYVSGDYSFLVQDKNGKTIYSQLNGFLENSDWFISPPRGNLGRAARVPPSFNFDLIKDTGFYSWSNAATTNYPPLGNAADLYLLSVVSSPDGNGIITQRCANFTKGSASADFEVSRTSSDDGATWTSWASISLSYITIDDVTPPAVAIIASPNTTIMCDTTTAGASINLDIRVGATTSGYRAMVFTVGPDTRQTIVQYATGVYEYIPAGTSQEFVWTGSAWAKTQASWAEKYLLGDMLTLPDKPIISCRAPLVDRSIDNDLSATNYPTYVPHLRSIKCTVNGVSDFSVTVAGSNITFPNTTEANAALQAIINEASVAHYVNNGEIANYLGGTDYSTAATQQSVNVAGVDYVITACVLVTRIVTVTGSPASGAQTASFYAHRIAGSTTTARQTKIGGFIPAPIGDAGLELVAGKRKMDREQGHRHDSIIATDGGGTVTAFNSTAIVTTATNISSRNGAVRDATTDTVNGTPRTGKSTAPLETARNFYDWAGVYN